jgi:hypothetical protein
MRGRPGRRLTAVITLAAAWCSVSLAAPAAPAGAAGSLTAASWTVSKTTTGATGVSYAFSFTTATPSSLTSVTMTVPAGTAGSPAVAAVSPASIAGGTIGIAGGTLTYTFTAATLGANTAVSIRLSGLTNSTTSGAYTSNISTRNGASSVDSGTSGTVTLTAGVLASPGWSVSSTTPGATGVSYTFTGTTGSAGLVTSVTMTVPPGTGGTPALVSSSPFGLLGSVSLSGTTLTYSGISLTVLAGTAISIVVGGLTNTSVAGSYTAEIATHALLAANLDSGVTPAVTFSGNLSLTSPGALGWSATLSGTGQSAVDGTAAHQKFSVDDETATGAGWHITVSASTFTAGARTLPNSGTFVLTGSLTSPAATTGPAAACVSSCTPPVSTASYPVAITTAASSPPAATVYDTGAASGLGPVAISPVGWWVNILASALAGSYTSTVTVNLISGP